MPSRTEQEFYRELLKGSEILKRTIGYNPTRFLNMVDHLGAVTAVRTLLASMSPSDGFTTLWEHRKLDLSCEAIALLPWYSSLFSEDELNSARQKLLDYRFDVDGFLNQNAATPPSWFKE